MHVCSTFCTNMQFKRKIVLPVRHAVCVCHPWSHRDAFAFVLLQGDTAPDCRPCLTKLCNLVGYPAWPAGRTCNFPFPNGKRLSQEPRCFNVLIFSLHCRCERIAVSLFVRRSFSSFWALLPLEDLQDPVVRTCTLRKWNPSTQYPKCVWPCANPG